MTGYMIPITVAAIFCLAGCGGGGGGGGNKPPVVTGPANLTSDQAATIIDLVVNDPEGGALTYAWSWVSGPSPVVRFSNPAIRNPEVSVPLSGPYVLGVDVTDTAGAVTHATVALTVSDTASFSIETRVREVGPAAGVRVALVWKPANAQILSASSDADGRLSFAGLMGAPDDFRVSGGAVLPGQ